MQGRGGCAATKSRAQPAYPVSGPSSPAASPKSVSHDISQGSRGTPAMTQQSYPTTQGTAAARVTSPAAQLCKVDMSATRCRAMTWHVRQPRQDHESVRRSRHSSGDGHMAARPVLSIRRTASSSKLPATPEKTFAALATTAGALGRSGLAGPTTEAQIASADVLLQNLVARGLLSCNPKYPLPDSPDASVPEFQSIARTLEAYCPASQVRLVARVASSTATAAAYSAVHETLGPERLLWHGTSWDVVPNIVRHGFNRAYAYEGARHGGRLGRGTYFAEDPTYALRFCGRGSPRALFLAGVLPGTFTRGEEGLVEPPIARDGTRFDSTVDNASHPKVFCVFRDFQALPLYLVEIA